MTEASTEPRLDPFKKIWPSKRTPEDRERALTLDGFVILGRHPGGNAVSGIIENSFSMSVSSERVLFWFLGTAYSNLGTKHELTREKVLKNCQRYIDMFSKDGMEYVAWDVRDPDLPVELNWERWLYDSEPSDRTLSGVRDKFGARNIQFRMRGSFEP